MEDINDIKLPIETPVINENFVHLFLIFLLILFFLVSVTVFYIFWKKYKKKQNKKIDKTGELKKKIDYHKQMKDQLKEVKRYIAEEEFKIFYMEISKVLKKYLSYKYRDNFTDLTASEILQNKKIDKEKKIKLEKIFLKSDMVKFAQQADTSKEMQDIYNVVESIIC